MIRFLIMISVALIVVWSAYWFTASRNYRGSVIDLLDNVEESGLIVDYADVSVRGFPNRLDLTVSDFRVSDPSRGVSWSTPEFQLLTLSYLRNHLILAWPEAQTLVLPGETITVSANEMQASLEFASSKLDILEQLVLQADGLHAGSDEGWWHSLDKLLIALRREEAGNGVYRLALSTSSHGSSPTNSQLPDTLDLLLGGLLASQMDGTIEFDKAIGRKTCLDESLQLRRLLVDEGHLGTDAINVTLTGNLSVEPDGYPAGTFEVSILDWKSTINFLKERRIASNEALGALTLVLGFAAMRSEDPDSASIKVQALDRQLYIETIKITSLPSLSKLC